MKWRRVLVVSVLVPLTGCSYGSYSHYTDAIKANTVEVAKTRQAILTDVLDRIFNECQKQVQAQTPAKPMITIESMNDEGKLITTTVFHPEPDRSMVEFLNRVGQSMLMRETVPLIEAVMDDLAQKVEVPITTETVLLEIAENTGILATVAGMYGLGAEAVRSAKSNIIASASNGGSISTGGAAQGVQHTSTQLTDDHSSEAGESAGTTD